MSQPYPYTEIDMLRSFSLVFSRSVFKDIIDYHDFTRLDAIVEQYDIGSRSSVTYADVIRKIYRTIRKKYCCEYVYKNEFITKILINQYGTSKTVAFNEFKIPPSIVDIALFNGESKAFEIKTEYDSPKRLSSQLENYTMFFDKCYLIVSEDLLDKYIHLIDEKIGVLLLSHTKTSVELILFREAHRNQFIDIALLMRVLHTQEYKNIIETYYGTVPNVSCFKMFDRCFKMMKQIPLEVLRPLILKEIKHRKNNTSLLRSSPIELRQIALSLNLKREEIDILKESLNKPISSI